MPVAEPLSLAEFALLEQRAREAAAVRHDDDYRDDGVEMFVFEISGERFALATRHVLEAVKLVELEPVPGAAPQLVGVTSLRGDLLPVFDLRKLFGMPSSGLHDNAWVVVVGDDDDAAELGLVADAIHAVERRSARAIEPAADLAEFLNIDALAGVTADGIAVLDGQRLLNEPRLSEQSAAAL